MAITRTTSNMISDVGTGANQLVRLDANAKLPAVDGSQLTNVVSGGETNAPYFSAKGSTTQTVVHNTDTTLQFNTIIDSLDSASGFNTSTYAYTVQSGGAGLWYLKAGFYWTIATGFDTGEQIQVKVQKNGNDVLANHSYFQFNSNAWLMVDGIVKLAVGDVIRVNTWQNTGNDIVVYTDNQRNSGLFGFRVVSI
jgi:hypothetical protein